MKAQITKTHGSIDVAMLRLNDWREYSIAAHAPDAAGIQAVMAVTAEEYTARNLSSFVFGGCDPAGRNRGAAWLRGDCCDGSGTYSMQISAISGGIVRAVSIEGGGDVVVYEDEHARYCRLSGIIAGNTEAAREIQTQQVFTKAARLLESENFRFTDVVRTWIYLDRLLEWYAEFNTVRTAFFQQQGVFDAMVPASTGIGAANCHGSAILMDVLAIQPKSSSMQIETVKSPLQNPALDYKSSFSRAVEIRRPDCRKLLISGTASIDSRGNTVHIADPEKQIRLTLDVVAAILRSRGMGWNDAFRGIAYFKDMKYQPIYKRVAADYGLPRFPLTTVHADICRDNLLFELELDAAASV